MCVLVRGVTPSPTHILKCSTYVGMPEFSAGKWPAFFSAGGKKWMGTLLGIFPTPYLIPYIFILGNICCTHHPIRIRFR